MVDEPACVLPEVTGEEAELSADKLETRPLLTRCCTGCRRPCGHRDIFESVRDGVGAG